jgi:hypothetical protein
MFIKLSRSVENENNMLRFNSLGEKKKYKKGLDYIIFVTWMHSFPLIFLWIVYKNVNNS